MSRTPVWTGAVLLAAAATCLAGRSDADSPAAPPDVVPGRVLVAFRPEVSSARVQGLAAAAGARLDSSLPQIGVRVLEFPGQGRELDAASALARLPEVAFAVPDRVIRPCRIPNDSYYGLEWHLPKVSAPGAWDMTTGAGGVTIAILDSGVDASHPDLGSKLVPGWNVYDNNGLTDDVSGHGTAVAGVAGACTNNTAGVSAVTWNCPLMPIRITDPDGYGYVSTIADGLVWAADHGARVANISYRAPNDPVVDAAATYFESKGGVVVMSAGNDSTFDPNPPDPNLLLVSATDTSDAVASFSNTGNNVDIAAPGVGIRSAVARGTYGAYAGTSVSAPIVAGAAALVISLSPSFTATQVKDVLKQSADDLGAPGWDAGFGWGRVNLAKAAQLAGGVPSAPDTTPPTVSITSPANAATVAGTITVKVSASDNTGVASVRLSVDGSVLGSASAAPCSFSWNTAAGPDGSHNLVATAFDAAGNSASTQVTVAVKNSSGDTTAPTISITSPGGGSTIGANGATVSVATSDNVGVVKVSLYVDGTLTATSTTAPFTFKWNTRKVAAGTHSLQCKASDAAGNTGASASVTVNR